MNITKVFLLLVCVCACLLLTQAAWAQGYKLNISLTDIPGDTGVVTIGLHPNATYGIDGPLAFGPGDTVKEVDFPPPGPANFDVRLVSIPLRDSLVNGSLASIHKLNRITQTDRWKITFQPESDSGNASPMHLSWPAGLALVGGGYWHLQDAFGGDLCDMTTQTSYTMGNSDPNPQSVVIVTGDGAGFLTTTPDSIGLSTDFKGKSLKWEKFGKAKPYQARFSWTLTNNDTGATTTKLHLEFGMGIAAFEGINPPPLTPPVTDGKIGKFDLVYDSIPKGSTITINALGAKGKPLTIKKYNFNHGQKKPIIGVLPNPNPGGYLLLHMPNWLNVGEELYLQGSGLLGTTGLTVGLQTQVAVNAKNKPVFRGVFHPKWTDVIKSFRDKSGGHPLGTENWLQSVSGKPLEKLQKALPPGKSANVFFAELLALKFNIAMSAVGKTETGFGALLYDSSGGAGTGFLSGATVDSIAHLADMVISHDSSVLSVDLEAVYQTVVRINRAFSGAMDTNGYAGKTALKPARILAFLNPAILYRNSIAAPAPFVGDPNWASKAARPELFKLEQNYPNPFNPTTQIEFNLSSDAFVTLKVYNMLGQEVATLLNHEQMPEGSGDAQFNASRLASGVYFYRLVAEAVDDNGIATGRTLTQVKKMMLLK